MTRKPLSITYVHAGDLSTKQAHALEWCEGDIGLRYQELAIVGERVIGAWQYGLEWNRGAATIDSCHTGVSPRFRRRGVAKGLWLHGVALWRPVRIKATIGTDEGRDFLARITARLAYASPRTYLWVTPRKEDTDWDARCEQESREFLRTLGRKRVDDAARRKLPQPAQKLALVAGGTP